MCPTTSDTTDTSPSTFPLLVPPCCNIRVFDSHATSSHTLSFIQFQTYVTKTTFPEQRDAIREYPGERMLITVHPSRKLP